MQFVQIIAYRVRKGIGTTPTPQPAAVSQVSIVTLPQGELGLPTTIVSKGHPALETQPTRPKRKTQDPPKIQTLTPKQFVRNPRIDPANKRQYATTNKAPLKSLRTPNLIL